MGRTGFLVVAGIVAVLAGPASAQPYNLTVAGYSPGGLVSTAGAGLDRALNAAFAGSTVTYQTSSGGLANATLVDQKKVPLGFISDTELNVAVNGKPPFKEPIKSLRLLFNPYSAGSRFQATHVLVSKEWADKHGIKSVADIAQKKPPFRVAINRPGNLDGDAGLAVLTANGITQDNIKAWGGQVVRAASQEMTSLMQDRRLDGVIFGISINHPRVAEMANGLPLVMLPLKAETVKKISQELGGGPCEIKASEYKFLAEDTPTLCVGLSTVVHADMDQTLVYNVVKGITENLDKYQAAHRLLKEAVTLQSFTQKAEVAYHPGAEKYYREKGLLK